MIVGEINRSLLVKNQLVLRIGLVFIALVQIIFSQNAFSQEALDPYSKEYQELKMQGMLQQPEPVPIQNYHPPVPPPADNSMLIPLDDSFTIAMTANDDGYTSEMAIPFSFQFYGNTLNSFYINNNGNVSFGSAYSTYTPSGFPVSDFPMLAPFWADVDTRGSGSGLVYYRIEPNRVTVIWDHVGYYSSHYDKLCTFEVIFTDGTDPLIGIGNNVAFCYDDMQWTTGDASGGSSGFGGSPATVGANKGDGINYFLVGRFDHEGIDYDGPGGNSDGVSFLDNNCFSFNTGGSSNNIPPVPQGFTSSQPVEISLNEVFNLSVGFISPEIGQITDVIVNVPPALNGFNYTVTPANVCIVDMDLTPNANNLGTHEIEFIATDNGTPPESTTTYLSVLITGYMELIVDPLSLSGSLCANESIDQTIILTNTGDGNINYTVSDASSWLTEFPVSGTISSGDFTNLQVTIDATGLSPGYHTGQVIISTNVPDNPEIIIPISLEVLAPMVSYIIAGSEDNENNELSGIPDYDIDTYLCKGDEKLPIEFNFFINQSEIESAELIIETFDVDMQSGNGLPYNEVNEVFFNGTLIGVLSGNNEGVSYTTLPIPRSLFVSGVNAKNLVQIHVSVLGKYWCTNVQSAELRIYNCSN